MTSCVGLCMVMTGRKLNCSSLSKVLTPPPAPLQGVTFACDLLVKRRSIQHCFGRPLLYMSLGMLSRHSSRHAHKTVGETVLAGNCRPSWVRPASGSRHIKRSCSLRGKKVRFEERHVICCASRTPSLAASVDMIHQPCKPQLFGSPYYSLAALLQNQIRRSFVGSRQRRPHPHQPTLLEISIPLATFFIHH